MSDIAGVIFTFGPLTMHDNPFASPQSPPPTPGWRTEIGIIGTDDLSEDELFVEVLRGGRFVVYTYCFSVLVYTHYEATNKTYFIRRGESRLFRGLGWSLATLLLGPWALRGPFYSLIAIGHNLLGGSDVTLEVVENVLRWDEEKLQALDECL